MQLWNQLKPSLEEHLLSTHQPQHHRLITSTATQTCGGKEHGRVTVKMTSFGLLGHGCPPSCWYWDIGPLSSAASPLVLACFCSMIISQDIRQDCGLVWLPSRTLTTSTCSQTLALRSLRWLKGWRVSVLGVIAWKSPSFSVRSGLDSHQAACKRSPRCVLNK